MSWQDKLDFLRSIKEIQSDERKGMDFCIDPLRFNDLSEKGIKDELILLIKDQLKNSYSVDPLIKIDVPKANYILRPAARPCLIDWVVYNAIVNFIAGYVYKKVPRNTFSFNKFRDKQDEKKRGSSIDYWLEFDDTARKYVNNSKYSHLLVTDITSFFEHIGHESLKKRLLCFSNDRDYVGAVNFLMNNLLMQWSTEEKIQGFGLPQGPTASTVLADIYLYSLDKALNKHGVKFIRYMDDFRLFAQNLNQLKNAIKILVRSLRELKLNLNAKKTTIYDVKEQEKLKNVFDSERERLLLIDTAFRSKMRNQMLLVKSSLFELKNKFNDPQFGERYLRFYIGKLIDMMKYDLVDEKVLLGLLDEFFVYFIERHHLANRFCWFFVACASYNINLHKDIQTRMIEFVCDKDRNIYEWQEMWALDTIRQLGKISIPNLKKIKSKYSSNSDLCYMQYALIAGESSDVDEREELLEGKRVKGDQYRSTLLAIQEMNMHVVSNAHINLPLYYQKYLSTISKNSYGFKYILNKEKFNEVEASKSSEEICPIDEYDFSVGDEAEYVIDDEPDFTFSGY